MRPQRVPAEHARLGGPRGYSGLMPRLTIVDDTSSDRDLPFSEWLRSRLDERRISQRQLAARSGVHHSTISRLLREHRSPSHDTVVRIARALEARSTDAYVLGSLLRRDPYLEEPDVRRILALYTQLRARRASDRATPAARIPARRATDEPGAAPGVTPLAAANATNATDRGR